MAESKNQLLLDKSSRTPSLLDELLLNRNENPKDKPLITAIPKSNVLGKVKDFLGVMAKANEKLDNDAKNYSHSVFDIEVLKGDEKEYIEMDLLLGVAELNNAEAVAAAEATMSGFCPQVNYESSSSLDTEEEEKEEDDDGVNDTCCNEEKSKCSNKSASGEFQINHIDEKSESLTRRKSTKRPKIIVLDQKSD